ncbi:aminopeptidase [Hydrogenibacillus schlegelii]|nr:aminopeptidase [Hydrogenibacillus schlegelii]
MTTELFPMEALYKEVPLEAYARLAVKKGVALEAGQMLVLRAPLEAAPFVREIVRIAYEAGAAYVHVEWSDGETGKMRYKVASEAALRTFPKWLADGYEAMAREGAAFLTVYAPDPDLLVDVPPERVALANKTVGEATKPYRALLMSDHARWSLLSAPTAAWAKKVFPDLPPAEAVRTLWRHILAASRVTGGDPLENWEKHAGALGRRVRYLNEKRYRALHFRGPGTDLVVGLPEGHVWQGGGSRDRRGIFFLPNIPTEEVYTLPHRERVDGVVAATKPLNYNGVLIDGIRLEFRDGAVVSASAKTNEAALRHLLEMDEGARRLGEVALVPDDSPISRSGVLFYNTLYDENAACHLALGKAYPTTLEGGAALDEAALLRRGANVSLVHEDFMIGSGALDVDGVTEAGDREPLLVSGRWAFDV